MDDQQIASWFAEAQRAKAAGDLARAETQYKKVIGARPDLAEARSNLGVVHYLQGRCDDGLRQFGQALALNRELAIPLLFSGICYQRMHQYAKAVSVLQRSVANHSRQPEAMLYLALSYSGVGDEERANTWFGKFAAVNPRDSEALYQLGGSDLRLSAAFLERSEADRFFFALARAEAAEQLGKPEPAVRARYEEAISLRPTWPNLHWRLARILRTTGVMVGAQTALTQELMIEPNHIPALQMMADIQREAGSASGQGESLSRMKTAASAFPDGDVGFTGLARTNPAKALSLLNILLTTAQSTGNWSTEVRKLPALSGLGGTLRILWSMVVLRATDEWALDVYAHARMARGELEILRDQLAPLAGLGRRQHIARYLLADVYHRHALATYTRMVELNPGGYHTMLLRAETLESAHRDSEAEDAYRATLSTYPNSRGVHYRLGQLLLRKHRNAEAAAEFEHELADDPYHTAARVAAAEIFVENRDFEQAVAQLRRTIDEASEVPAAAFLVLARAYLGEGRPADAATMLERALKLAPGNISAHYQLAQTYQELGREAEASREFMLVRKLRIQTKALP